MWENEFRTGETCSSSFNNIREEDEDWINIEDTDWYREMKASRTPEGNLKFYRTQKKMSRKSLAELLGVNEQDVSDMENGRKDISRATAERLADYFNVSVSRFI